MSGRDVHGAKTGARAEVHWAVGNGNLRGTGGGDGTGPGGVSSDDCMRAARGAGLHGARQAAHVRPLGAAARICRATRASSSASARSGRHRDAASSVVGGPGRAARRRAPSRRCARRRRSTTCRIACAASPTRPCVGTFRNPVQSVDELSAAPLLAAALRSPASPRPPGLSRRARPRRHAQARRAALRRHRAALARSARTPTATAATTSSSTTGRRQARARRAGHQPRRPQGRLASGSSAGRASPRARSATPTATGSLDQWVEYGGGKPSLQRDDKNGDGKPDATLALRERRARARRGGQRTSTASPTASSTYHASGQPARVEEDTNGDGKPDAARRVRGRRRQDARGAGRQRRRALRRARSTTQDGKKVRVEEDTRRRRAHRHRSPTTPATTSCAARPTPTATAASTPSRATRSGVERRQVRDANQDGRPDARHRRSTPTASREREQFDTEGHGPLRPGAELRGRQEDARGGGHRRRRQARPRDASFDGDSAGRSEADTNGDGRADTFVTLPERRARGARKRTATTTGRSTRATATTPTARQLAGQELDEDYDGRFETQRRLRRRRAAAQGASTAAGDGRPERVEHWGEGRLVRVELDENGDGRFELCELLRPGGPAREAGAGRERRRQAPTPGSRSTRRPARRRACCATATATARSTPGARTTPRASRSASRRTRTSDGKPDRVVDLRRREARALRGGQRRRRQARAARRARRRTASVTRRGAATRTGGGRRRRGRTTRTARRCARSATPTATASSTSSTTLRGRRARRARSRTRTATGASTSRIALRERAARAPGARHQRRRAHRRVRRPTTPTSSRCARRSTRTATASPTSCAQLRERRARRARRRTRTSTGASSSRRASRAASRCASEADTNGDGKPDVVVEYRARQAHACRREDRNGDGKPDVVTHFDADGKRGRVEEDRRRRARGDRELPRGRRASCAPRRTATATASPTCCVTFRDGKPIAHRAGRRLRRQLRQGASPARGRRQQRQEVDENERRPASTPGSPSTPAGAVAKREKDKNGDGKPDVIAEFKGGKLVAACAATRRAAAASTSSSASTRPSSSSRAPRTRTATARSTSGRASRAARSTGRRRTRRAPGGRRVLTLFDAGGAATVQETVSDGATPPGHAPLPERRTAACASSAATPIATGRFDARVTIGPGGRRAEALVDTNGDGMRRRSARCSRAARSRGVEIDTNSNGRADVVQHYAGPGRLAPVPGRRPRRQDRRLLPGREPGPGERQSSSWARRSRSSACGSAHEFWRRF